jgi:hypothetical protein
VPLLVASNFSYIGSFLPKPDTSLANVLAVATPFLGWRQTSLSLVP